MIDLTNKKFEKLTVVSMSENRGNRNQIKWNCICDCGNRHVVTGESLRHGKSKSCGCLKSGRPVTFKENRVKALWTRLYSSTIKKRAKKNGYKTDITLNDFIAISKKPCFYCGDIGVQMAKDNANGTLITDTIINFNGIDRVDSTKGYYLNNVVSCCKHCNTAKNALTQEDFKALIRKIYENFVL